MNRKGFLVIEIMVVVALMSLAGYIVHTVITQPAPAATVECVK